METARLSTGMSLSGARRMLTGRLPMGTSFKILFSNFRLSFAISVSSSGRWDIGGQAHPPAHSREEPVGCVLKVHNHNGNVVLAAVFICQAHQPFRRALRVCLCQ